MNSEIEKYELIERFLKGSLEATENEVVLKAIHENPEFAAEVEKHKAFHNFIFDSSMLDLKNQIKNIHEKNSGSHRGMNWRNLTFTGIAIILLTIPLVISRRGRQSNTIKKQVVEQPSLVNKNTTLNDTSSTQTKKPKTITIKRKVPVPSVKGEITHNVSVDSAIDKALKPENIHSDTSQKVRKFLTPKKVINNVDNTVKTENPAPVKALNEKKGFDCSNIIIEAEVKTENSCNTKASGKIVIDRNSITGGKPPYLLSIDGGANYYSEYTFTNLIPTVYELFIKDANNCSGKLGNYKIDKKDCTYEYVFSPDKGEVWSAPTQGLAGEISIYNTSGAVVLSEKFEEGNQFEWNGRDINGNEMPMGVYMFKISLSDSDIKYGNVTIVR